MKIILKFQFFLLLIITSFTCLAGSEDVISNVNLYSDIYHFVSNNNLTVNMVQADKVDATSVQNCRAYNQSSCQNYSGVSGVQTAVSADNNTHKVVVAVTGNASVDSYARQNVTLNNKSAQNCAATSCIQIME